MQSPRRALAATTAALVAGLALGACSLPPGSGVPDDVLAEQIGEIPGVTSVTLEYRSDWTRGKRYAGEIVADPALSEPEVRCVVRQVSEILWQGRRTTDSSLVLVHGDQRATLLMGDRSDTFGPRPDRPRPTATVTPCEPGSEPTPEPAPEPEPEPKITGAPRS
ncbi:hypothetical protein GC089_14930 [Cellulomonas sp. JZ18]|uniref:hypothetical protein n=1 Tax=Cellulomonas sp. JZ18 TaxID=2654191 RepID=UPI0012D493FE|nr:hypothetical protein [Cellulomonas sp. JZ18]QGQ20254.1 hypothetical protein GC089_14930 [Cellulomonas sp. JZ18]